MELIRVYECLCDATRLRIVHLLTHGPLCVCHFQEILDEPQVKISRHLAYLRERGMVGVTRHENWMIYHLPEKPSPELEANLKCLQDLAPTDKRFRADRKRLEKLRPACGWVEGTLKEKQSCNC
jgi:ArsR family transcriptional regulator